MAKTEQRIVSITRLGAKGRLTLPAQYRRALALSGDAALALVQVGDALVIAPHDEALAAVTQRLEAQMHRAGSDVDDLLAAAADARAEIVREEFGVTAEE
jgi:bifunctional DNA-binding transcriptional regulator/antitoxin component of YhaV-PrlF toxin-antitoxin module